MKEQFTTDEINEHFVNTISAHLNEFCFGKYKDDVDSPVSMTRSEVTIENKKLQFKISCRLHKDEKGVLKNCMIYFNEIK